MFYKPNIESFIDFFNLTKVRGNDIIEMIIIISIIYYILKSLKDTRAWVVAKGCVVLFLLYGIAYFASFKVVTYIAGTLFTFFSIALVIMFQPELRKLLENLGNKNLSFTKIYNKIKKDKTQATFYSAKSIDEILKATNIMSKAKTGALILIEKNSPLNEYEESGIVLNADISSQLIVNAFEKNTPLHDGAMIIKNNKITAATCYLPLSDNRRINKSLGTRHRAAIGASEQTDALIIVVSEETGAISIVQNGNIKHNISIEKLRETLVDNQIDGTKELIREPKFSQRKFKLWFLSVLFGCFLWFFLTDVTNPVVTVQFNDIPVSIINTDSIDKNGYVYEVSSGDTVDISVKGQKSAVSELTSSDFVATADASKLSITNSMNIDVSSKKNSQDIEIDTKNALMTISIEEAVSTECLVVPEKKGTEPDGFFVTQLIPETKTITITGPKSKIKTIEKAVCEVKVDNFTSDFDVEYAYDVYDKNGDKVDLTDLKISTDKIKISGSVCQTKEVPINITAKDSSVEDSMVELTNLNMSKNKITISASQDILDTIDSIDIELDVSNYDDKINTIINVENYLKDGIYFVGKDDEITISANIKKIAEKEIEIKSSDINIQNGSCRFYNDKYNIIAQYAYTSKSKTLPEFNTYVDLSGTTKGRTKVTLKTNTENITFKDNPEITVYVEG